MHEAVCKKVRSSWCKKRFKCEYVVNGSVDRTEDEEAGKKT